MVSKNNLQMYDKKMNRTTLRYSLRKLNIGVASVLLGISFSAGVMSNQTEAAAATPPTAPADAAVNEPGAVAPTNEYVLSQPQTNPAKMSASQSDPNGRGPEPVAQVPVEGADKLTSNASNDTGRQDLLSKGNDGASLETTSNQSLDQSGATTASGVTALFVQPNPSAGVGSAAVPTTPAGYSVSNPESYPAVPDLGKDYYIFRQYQAVNPNQSAAPGDPTGLPIVTYAIKIDPAQVANSDFTDLYAFIGDNTTPVAIIKPGASAKVQINNVDVTFYNLSTTTEISSANYNQLGFVKVYDYGRNVANAKDNSTSNIVSFMPVLIKQVTKYVDSQGNEVAGQPQFSQDGITGQKYTTANGKVIPGYYLVKPGNSDGYMSQFSGIGSQYKLQFVDDNHAAFVYTLLDDQGTMQVGLEINGAIVESYKMTPDQPPILSKEYGPGKLTYYLSSPYIPQTTDIEYVYHQLGILIPVGSDGRPIPNTQPIAYTTDPNDPTKAIYPRVPHLDGYTLQTVPGIEENQVIPTPATPGTDTKVVYIKNPPISIDQPTRQTVTFTGAGDQTPAPNVQADFTLTGSEDPVTHVKTWNDNGTHTYPEVRVPVVSGYYADKTEAGGLAVTLAQPTVTETVTYRPLGQLVPEVPGQQVPAVPYGNDPQNPTEPGQPIVPTVPGYHPEDPKFVPGQPYVPADPGKDTPIKYVKDNPIPLPNVPTKQTVTFTGAGAQTPAPNVQTDFTFTGSEDPVTHEKTWNDNGRHTYPGSKVPVVPGYYADKTEAGGLAVTPDQPTVTETVTYRPLGQLVPEVPGQQVPGVPYGNDPQNPTEPGQPIVPTVPGYHPEDPKFVPGQPYVPADPGKDTPIKYVKDDSIPLPNVPTKQTVTFTGAGAQTPASNVQTDFTFTGSEDPVTHEKTWNDNGTHTYPGVKVPVVPGYYADKIEAGGMAVTPDQPTVTETVTYRPLGQLVPEVPGQQVPGVPYGNDPQNPTEPGQPIVPTVPGYHPEDPKFVPGQPYIPTDPGKDTIIKYVPNQPEQPGNKPQTPGPQGQLTDTPKHSVPQTPQQPVKRTTLVVKVTDPSQPVPQEALTRLTMTSTVRAPQAAAKRLPQTGNQRRGSLATLGLISFSMTSILGMLLKKRFKKQ